MLRITTEDRKRLGPLGQGVILILSLTAGLGVLALGLFLNGKDPILGIVKLFSGGFFSSYGLIETLARTVPLVLIGVGLSVAYRGKFWNIGAEGQLLAGAVLSLMVGLAWPDLPFWVLIPAMTLAGFLGGALWGLISAALKSAYHINEVISTLMLNYVIIEFVKFLVTGPMKGHGKQGQTISDELSVNGILGVFDGTKISPFTVILAAGIIILIFFVLYRTKFGYEVRVLGENPEAARYAGISKTKTSLMIMVISGGLAGLAGFNEIAANHHHLTQPLIISGNLGFTGIIVAWLARLNPLWVVFSSFFFAGILVGGDSLKVAFNLPAATIYIFNGVILIFLIMGDFFAQTRVRLSWKKRGES